MSNDYERQRELTISKNKELLKGLSLLKAKGTAIQKRNHQSPPRRRKLESPVAPLRTSSRLAGQPKRSYVEEDDNNQPTPRKPPTRPPSPKVKTLTETEVHDIVQRWQWQSSAGLPAREADGMLHFDGFRDVFSPSIGLN